MIPSLKPLRYIDRKTGQEKTEKVYGKFFINLFYSESWVSKLFYLCLLPLVTRFSFLSLLYGRIQKSARSRKKIRPFIQQFGVDTADFIDPVESYRSFNDFFIRKLKPTARPLTVGEDIAILPADARYLVYENLAESEGFFVKGKKFSLRTLLQSESLAEAYAHGSMAIARLAPVDYHRYHFPLDCLPEKPLLIPGNLFSVNPAALKRNMHILAENKRVITALRTKNFGTVLFIEIGATYVGTIHQTFVPGELYSKGDEKGYFSFGGSCIILLFEPGRIQFDQDLLEASHRRIEVLGQMGQSLGRCLSSA